MEKICVCRKCKGSYYIKVGECDPGLCEKCRTGFKNEKTRAANDFKIKMPSQREEHRNIAILFCKPIENKHRSF